VICPTCRDAADQRAPRDQHCHDPKCMCGHRTDKYQPPTGLGMPAALHNRMRTVAGQLLTAAPLPPMIRHLADSENPEDTRPVITAAMLRATPHTDTTKD
jgi:hypothetical protein